MRKWREQSNVLMSYLKEIGIWIKMKKTPKQTYVYPHKERLILGPYYAHILCTYIMYVCSCVQ